MANDMIKPSNKSNQLAVINTDNQLQFVGQWTNDFKALARTQNANLSSKQMEFGVSIISGLVDRCVTEKIAPRDLNMTNILDQVKHCSKLELSLAENELFLDIRNNGKTGKKDVTIKKQYQGIQKIMTRFCTKKIVRFLDGVVCKGDDFDYEQDFMNGTITITKHKKDTNVQRNDLKNIVCAYAIAYVKENENDNKVTPYTMLVDKDRLMRAYNCATTKNVWNSDTTRMCIKTAYWCLYADMKPFIELPADIQESFAKTEDDMDFTTPNSTNDTVYDMDATDDKPNEVVEPENIVDVETSEIETHCSDDEPEPENTNDTFLIPYGEFKDNKSKYDLIEYHKDTKEAEVRLKSNN